MNVTLEELARFLASVGMPCEVDGDCGVAVSSVATLEDAREGQLSFLSNPKYEKELATTAASAVLVRSTVQIDRRMNLLRTADPYAAFQAAMVKLHGYRRHPAWGRSGQAHISPTAVIGENANIAPSAYIDDEVCIGKNATIYPGVFIARGCRVGSNVTLFANVVIYDGCVLGDRVTVHACSVIGEDGLGYAPVGDKWVKIPQVGNAVLGNDVEIGAGCTIDRATLGSTTIGNGTKFSNLIAIGHGTKIGEDCMFVAQVGVAGSAHIGRHVTMAGQAGIVGHIVVGDNATIGARAGVTNNVEAGVTMLGQPAIPIQECRRQVAIIQKLPELKSEIRRLRLELDQLKRMLDGHADA